MIHHHMTAEGAIPFTAQEEIDWQAVQDAYQAAAVPNAKAAFILQIDTDADALIRAVIGERASQYESAEKQSAAYKAAGYTGIVPPKVQAWATAKNQTATWAADSQIATAAAWRSAEDALYAKRLLLKEMAKIAVDGPALDTIKAQWSAFMVALTAQMTEA